MNKGVLPGLSGGAFSPGSCEFLLRNVPQRASGAWTPTNNGIYLDSRAIFSSTPLVGDYIEFFVPLGPGRWVVTLLYGTNTDRGILDLSINGRTVFTIDAYAGSSNGQVDSTSAPFDLPGSRDYLFRIMVTGKNASSSNYYAVLERFAFERVA